MLHFQVALTSNATQPFGMHTTISLDRVKDRIGSPLTRLQRPARASAGNAAAVAMMERRERLDMAFLPSWVCVNAPPRRNAAQYFCYCGFGADDVPRQWCVVASRGRACQGSVAALKLAEARLRSTAIALSPAKNFKAMALLSFTVTRIVALRTSIMTSRMRGKSSRVYQHIPTIVLICHGAILLRPQDRLRE